MNLGLSRGIRTFSIIKIFSFLSQKDEFFLDYWLSLLNKIYFFLGEGIEHWLLKRLRARLVIEFKNCCLKRCENCSLKSVIEIYVFSVYKTKKMCLVSWFK